MVFLKGLNDENKNSSDETSLVIQRINLCNPNARGLGSTLIRELDPTYYS